MENKSEEQSTAEKSIFNAIAQEDLDEFKSILAHHKGSVDLFDENGMTALQHAAYKGNKDMVQMLLDRGADVNSGKHEYNYTALHFGALSGNSDVCKLLLNAGAKPTATNSVGRTASQMAAFVGNHHTVATINNFVPLSEISYYSIPRGQQTEPYLPPVLVDPLHKFVLGVNIHPVRLALNLQSSPALLDNADKASKVLELLSKKEMTRGSDTNEVMAFKYHYLSYILNEIFNIRDKQKPNTESKEEKKHDPIEIFSKKLLKPGKDGVSLDLMDAFLKDCVREFPYRECTTFHQMVTSLTSKDPPPALSVINCTINGQRGFVDAIPYCSTCGEEKPAKKCSKCKTVQYCDRECQRLHWFVHKKACNREIAPVTTSTNTKPVIDASELTSQLQNLVAG
ncbi:PREDICTED: ankyrin repeat and MYND domain-containing protein 2 [Papilio xuthus]|uniref:Ankyrin repeat and MYND domain-containing protein 2 n=1 Tax=Papilio xuthus TaxID=66420 RepID=A0A194QHS6_PAPXU|nr:PREDICTED: ankyrin repeat and MYND domain-containing protein 2 [Papilio xuthus]KPJ05062.1 Ankyrin repeat and MYND domain-containing protein 2 [Papilio xuthus]